MLITVVAGGQTGVDQAALRSAQQVGLLCDGWCPPGRECESGMIPDQYPLRETPSERSSTALNIPRSMRTEWNVRDSDATLIVRPSLTNQDLGTDWTITCADNYKRPILFCDPSDPKNVDRVADWINALSIKRLNVAGPSEVTSPGIGEKAYQFLEAVFSAASRCNLT